MQKPRRTLGLTELTILRCLCAINDLSGGEITEYAAVRGVEIKPGHLYTTLRRLEGKAWLTSRMTPPKKVRGGRGVALWSVTDEGRDVYAKSARLFAGETNPA